MQEYAMIIQCKYLLTSISKVFRFVSFLIDIKVVPWSSIVGFPHSLPCKNKFSVFFVGTNFHACLVPHPTPAGALPQPFCPWGGMPSIWGTSRRCTCPQGCTCTPPTCPPSTSCQGSTWRGTATGMPWPTSSSMGSRRLRTSSGEPSGTRWAHSIASREQKCVYLIRCNRPFL